jgi:hypothetical protein
MTKFHTHYVSIKLTVEGKAKLEIMKTRDGVHVKVRALLIWIISGDLALRSGRFTIPEENSLLLIS